RSTVRRWMKGGKCNDELMTPHEKWLRNVYKKVLTLCNERDALREGGFFDLMYANLRQPGFDPHRQFAFLRYQGEDVLLIIANFSRETAHVSVMIPRAAFEAAGIPEGNVTSCDLLWGKPHKLTLAADNTVSVYLSAADAVVLPIGKCGDNTSSEAEKK
ncbi:MAG: hypothetical protein K2M63_09180, partial [Muribaculaceae bacterium]|nr:hypothetical protein [Muribaculaceae bacterium]